MHVLRVYCALILAASIGLFSACKVDSPALEPSDDHAHDEPEHSPDSGEWCHGHGLPESHCTKCHPQLIEKFKAEGDWCEEHGFPESACPQCNPMTPPGEESAVQESRAEIPGVPAGTQVIFHKDDHEETTGIEVVPARAADLELHTQVPAQLQFNQNALADIRASVPGIVRRVLVDLGDEVEPGAPLFELESARVGELQAQIRTAEQDAQTARADLERQEQLQARGLSATRRVEEARRELEQAEARQASLTSSLRLAGAGGQGSSGRYTLRAPIKGSVVRRPAVLGAFATDETSLATIADSSEMWAVMDVPERDAAAVSTGQSVYLTVDGRADEFPAQITWISPEVDPRTRSVAVRATVDNTDGALRANQFARAQIGLNPQGGVVIPREALQRIEDTTVVFVRARSGVFEPRVVRPGATSHDLVQVEGDLSAGDAVVTTGAFILKTELTPDSIGAGCCEFGD